MSSLTQCLKTITPNSSKIIIMSKQFFLSGLKYIYCELKQVFLLRESWGCIFEQTSASRSQQCYFIVWLKAACININGKLDTICVNRHLGFTFLGNQWKTENRIFSNCDGFYSDVQYFEMLLTWHTFLDLVYL